MNDVVATKVLEYLSNTPKPLSFSEICEILPHNKTDIIDQCLGDLVGRKIVNCFEVNDKTRVFIHSQFLSRSPPKDLGNKDAQMESAIPPTTKTLGQKRLPKRNSLEPSPKKQRLAKACLFDKLPGEGTPLSEYTLQQLEKYLKKKEERLTNLRQKKEIVEKKCQTDEEVTVETEKWIEACKESIVDLKELLETSTGTAISMNELLSACHIDSDVLNYDDDEEDFI